MVLVIVLILGGGIAFNVLSYFGQKMLREYEERKGRRKPTKNCMVMKT